jgi:Brp/Blh family beta-carotene 15,15'-monooxygenase
MLSAGFRIRFTAAEGFIQTVGAFPTVVWGVLLTLLFLALSADTFRPESTALIAGLFLTIGVSHGALDHLTDSGSKDNRALVRFVAVYLFKAGLFGLLWMLLPVVALVLFLLYSAWHFGQADFKEWGRKEDWKAFVWGALIIADILLLHPSETLSIISGMVGFSIGDDQMASPGHFTATSGILAGAVVAFSVLFVAFERSGKMFLTLSYIIVGTALPLLIAFGIYFTAQHSLNSWKQLKSGLGETYSRLWIRSLPFGLGGALLIFTFVFFGGSGYAATLFIVLSCLSIPHVIRMHRFYIERPR